MPAWARLAIGCLGFPIVALCLFVAIRFPEFIGERESTCLSNAKIIGLAVPMYSQDYDQQFPPAKHWQTVITPYSQKNVPNAPRIFVCPAAEGAKNCYAFNGRLGAVRSGDIPTPDSIVAIFETDLDRMNAHGGPEILVTPGRHGVGGNYAFADGHAKRVSDDRRPNFSRMPGKL